MAAIVWVLLVLAATSGCFADDDKSASSSEEVVQPVAPIGVLPEPVDMTNHKTGNCPNGERFMSECNWCSCNEQSKMGMCTLMGCINWSCEAQLKRLETQKQCYGACTCDDVTKISSCEWKGCSL